MSTLRDQVHAEFPDANVLESADIDAWTRDWWPLASVRHVVGRPAGRPGAVAFPKSTEEVSELVAWAAASGTQVTVRGGGSGVCGAAIPPAGALVLDMTHMRRVLALDTESDVVAVEAGILGDDLEAHLSAHGLTLGHYPQSMAISTVGGWIATASAGQATPGYGAIEDRLLGLTAVLADGEVVRLKPVPRSAAGPDLRRMFIGAEGTFGIVTEAVLACAPSDPGTTWLAFRFGSFIDCLGVARAVRRSGAGPRFSRAWDEPDATAAFFTRFGHDVGSVTTIGFSSAAPGLDGRLDAVRSIASDHGGEEIDPAYGAHWWQHRLDAVETFDRINGPSRSLGPGAILDTVEVAALWRDLPTVYGAVRSALMKVTEEVRCHFSHVYDSGAALYFTFVLREIDHDRLERAYARAWNLAMEACIASGGTISHHHGVGTLKSPYLSAELGSGVELLRRLVTAMDPQRVLNPGLLGKEQR